MEITAAVFNGAKQPLSIERLELAPPKDDEVLVKVIATGVCHSDLHVVNGHRIWPSPLVLGHEGAGIVESVGVKVESLKPGDHVALSWMPYCGRCNFCLSGHPNHCELTKRTSYLGVMHDGTTRLSRSSGEEVFSYLATASFANYAVVPETAAIKVRSDAPLDRVALVGCAVATGVGAVTTNANVPAGSSVMVIGCGGVGLSSVAGAALVGASPIIAVDINDEHLERAKRVGATHIINSKTQDVVETVRAITGTDGVDYAFEAIGLPKTIELAYQSLTARGTAVVVGQVSHGATITIDPYMMSERELTITGSNYGSTIPPVDFPKLVDLYMEGRLGLDALIERSITLEEINDALDAMNRGESARAVILHQH